MKARVIHIFYLVASLVMQGVTLYAQQVQVNARIDSTSILIGNQAHIHITAAYDLKNGQPKIQWQQVGDTLVSKIEVISKSKISTVPVDSAHPNIVQQTEDITISGYDSGYYSIPPFQFIINGDTANPLMTEAIMLTVNTVHVDTAKGFKDIKEPIQVPFNWLELIPYIGYGLLALLVIGGLAYFIYRLTRKEKPVLIDKPDIVIPPHIKALQGLENLALKKLWQEGKIKEYYTGITDILRVYIEERYGISALEMTTDEIILALKRKDISETLKSKLREVMVLADLVKFAKENPLPSDHEYCFNTSVDFVNETTEKIEEVKAEVPEEVKQPSENPQTL